MQETTQVIISGSNDQDRIEAQPVRVENLVVKPGTMEISLLAEPYEPCEGTWTEFVSDLKRTCLRIGSEVKGRTEVVKDAWNETFRRKRPQALGPK